MKQGQLFWIVLLLITCVFLSAYTENEQEIQKDANYHEAADRSQEIKNQKPDTAYKEITLSAIGDMLIHKRVYEDARTDDGGFNFMTMLERVKPYLNDSTITFANQETMIGGETLGLSTYPAFNSPFAVGNALKKAGVDVVSVANNHTLDRGETAIMNDTEHLEENEMM